MGVVKINREHLEHGDALVPYFVVESLIAIHKRQILQIVIAFIVSIVVMVIGFVYAWTSYDYESTESTTTTVQQDGNGVNIYGDENGVENGSENYSKTGQVEETN